MFVGEGTHFDTLRDNEQLIRRNYGLVKLEEVPCEVTRIIPGRRGPALVEKWQVGPWAGFLKRF
jgi:hypothetical protein